LDIQSARRAEKPRCAHLQNFGKRPAALVYAGDRTFEQHGVKVYSWQVL
jgi:hypothetical protein